MRGVMGIGISIGAVALAACGGMRDLDDPSGQGVGTEQPDQTRPSPADGSDNDDSDGTLDRPVGSGTIPSFGSGGSAGIAGSGAGSATYGGEGGATETPSDGGAPNEPSSCDSPVTGSLAEWVPREPDPEQSVSAVLTKARSVLTGSWHGTVSTVWFAGTYSVVATFGADGGYSAHCEQNSDYAGGEGCCRALYWGSDQDTELKRWSFDSVNESGLASGNMDVVFCYDDGCELAGWHGFIKNFEFDATENRVRFQFKREDNQHPLEVELERD